MFPNTFVGVVSNDCSPFPFPIGADRAAFQSTAVLARPSGFTSAFQLIHIQHSISLGLVRDSSSAPGPSPGSKFAFCPPCVMTLKKLCDLTKILNSLLSLPWHEFFALLYILPINPKNDFGFCVFAS